MLIVDDEKDTVDALTIRFKSLGYDVISASDGIAALTKAREEHPDIILLDIMLPKLDGYKICRMLKFDEKYKNIPIIMLTAKIGDEQKKLGKDVGADDYITKPFNTEDLVARVRDLLSVKKE